MNWRVKCLACGKLFPLPEGAGSMVLCHACGSWLTIGPLPPDPPAARSDDADVDVLDARPASGALATSRRRRAVAGAALGLFGLITCAIVVVVVLRPWNAPTAATSGTRLSTAPADGPDRAEHARLIQLKNEAESLAIAGKLEQAHAKYRELQLLLAGRRITDAVLWELMDRAKQDQDAIYAVLIRREAAKVLGPRDDGAPRPMPGAMPWTSDYPLTRPSTSHVAIAPASTRAVAVSATAPTSTAAPTQPASTAAARGIPTVRRFPKDQIVTDPQIDQAIRKGVDFILSHFQNNELKVGREINDNYHAGLNALCVWSLLQAGQATKDDRLSIHSPLMKGLIERMKEHVILADPTAEQGAPVTYARALRAAALSVHDREEDRKALIEDVRWLLEAQSDGAYTYDNRWQHAGAQKGAGATPGDPPLRPPPPGAKGNTRFYIDPDASPTVFDGIHDKFGREVFIPRPKLPPNEIAPPMRVPWDNSNSQFGLLGIWSAAETGVEIPDAYWRRVQNHWTGCQFADGQWGYSEGSKDGYLAMTAAGCASLFVTHDYLEAPSAGAKLGQSPWPAALAKGLAWLEAGDNCVNVLTGKVVYLGYNLLSVGRVGLASGLKYLGSHDWYRELAARAILGQFANGAWGRKADGNDALVDTAFIVVFLSRGRHPIMMNKLRVEDAWANRPRDLANLARFAGRELERPLNWQVVNLQRPWHDWLDAPVLYLAGHQYLRLTDEDVDKLRAFIEGGGMLFTHADGAAEGFNRFVADLARRIAPAAEMADLPVNHEIYALNYQVANPRPKLRALTNGARILLLHSPTDLSLAWQQRATTTKRALFELGTNIFIYAAGRTNLRNRLASPYVSAPTQTPSKTVKVARIEYAGNWNPEPCAWTRFARAFEWDTGVALSPVPTAAVNLDARAAPIAHLTGLSQCVLSDEEITAIRRYVEAGGVLLIDATAGAGPFAQSIPGVIERAFGDARLRPIRPTHPVLLATYSGMEDVRAAQLRPLAVERFGAGLRLEMLRAGRGCVLYTPLDLTCSLLGTNAWPIAGYTPRYAHELTRNIVLWTINGARDE